MSVVPPPPQGEPKTVLLVDDDDHLLEAYGRVLRRSPWRILTTVHGEEALEIIRRRQADLLVTDIKMPRMHGFMLIAKIRKESKEIPILVCSSYPGLRQDAELILNNVTAFLEKPVPIRVLAEKIQECLG